MKSNQSNSTTSGINDSDPEAFSFTVGKVVGFRGLKGEMKVLPSTNSPDILIEIESVRVGNPNDSGAERKVESAMIKGRTLFIRLSGYEDRTAAEALKDKLLFTQPDQLLELEENQWWVDDLIGLSVRDQAGNELGKIVDIYGADGEFLEVELKDTGKKRLVPFVKEMIPVVEPDEGYLVITPPPGLLD
ncbi:MAG TPA: ribosome maturation factor RimM [Candidatus Melainabacteria bacterium]|nr:ribosome maturation factor RimM [Candidatus Melainabacteria bacterium]